MNRMTFTLLLGSLVGLPSFAADLQTEWIAPHEGFTEPGIGARIKSIETLPADEGQRLTIEIPRSAMTEGEVVNEVIVTAQRPDKTESPLSVRHEWVADYEKDYYGLVLYLGNKEQLPLRIYLKSE